MGVDVAVNLAQQEGTNLLPSSEVMSNQIPSDSSGAENREWADLPKEVPKKDAS